ncbi:hypothetical protein ACE5IS_14245 [Leptospira wolffii]|uniref:Lipoprotein n=1 Tax=Leptospira wolffii TaxID=409998 RepID=A0ABV5BTY1_9LEPT|nr:hypothetical protein [Leptospira wolffii]TGL45299.1 hypothetical protein EHQ61_18700 [Leptospira wolffii]
MNSKFVIFFLFLPLLSFCQSDSIGEKEKKANQKQTLLSLATGGTGKSDCVYCSNTRAFEGNCSCYKDIALLTCAGLPAGPAKSNSYKVSCNELTSVGAWTESGPDSFSCTYLTCPAEAYRAAFTSEGK